MLQSMRGVARYIPTQLPWSELLVRSLEQLARTHDYASVRMPHSRTIAIDGNEHERDRIAQRLEHLYHGPRYGFAEYDNDTQHWVKSLR